MKTQHHKLRKDVEEVIKGAVLHGRANADTDIDYPVTGKAYHLLQTIADLLPKINPSDKNYKVKADYRMEVRNLLLGEEK